MKSGSPYLAGAAAIVVLSVLSMTDLLGQVSPRDSRRLTAAASPSEIPGPLMSLLPTSASSSRTTQGACLLPLSNGTLLYVESTSDGQVQIQQSTATGSWSYRATFSGTEQLSAQCTRGGRIVVLCSKEMAIVSTNGGGTWTSQPLGYQAAGWQSLLLGSTPDSILWLTYRVPGPNGETAIWGTPSTDGGMTWQPACRIASWPGSLIDATITSSQHWGNLLAVFSASESGRWSVFSAQSSNDGLTWQSPLRITTDTLSEGRPKIFRDTAGTLWLVTETTFPSRLAGFSQRDICWRWSSDGGMTWSPRERWTRFAGYDGMPSAVLMNDRPLVTFVSQRGTGASRPWCGLLGTTQDAAAPPHIFRSLVLPRDIETPVSIQTYADDDNGVLSIALTATVSGTILEGQYMSDDGHHQDGNAGDGLWGATIGPYTWSSTVSTELSIVDFSGNLAIIPGPTLLPSTLDLTLGNILLRLGDDSRLGDRGANTGYSVRWPAFGGNDYLYYGGLWIGAKAEGRWRIVYTDYVRNDWRRSAGVPIVAGPGLSDRDLTLTYEDAWAPDTARIGIRVTQRWLQWSSPGKRDFLAVQYTLTNLGSRGTLDSVRVGLWTDPDIPVDPTNTLSDLCEYDTVRGMCYSYDGIDTTLGLLGVRYLSPGAPLVHLYPSTADPANSGQHISMMNTRREMTVRTLADYRMLIVSPPFALQSGDTRTVSFGMVMGRTLNALRANADALAVLFTELTDVELSPPGTAGIPESTELMQNYPNPFNGISNFGFRISEPSRVKVAVYDLLGREVAVLVDGWKDRGRYQVRWDASHLSTGVYFCRMVAGGFVGVRKILLTR